MSAAEELEDRVTITVRVLRMSAGSILVDDGVQEMMLPLAHARLQDLPESSELRAQGWQQVSIPEWLAGDIGML